MGLTITGLLLVGYFLIFEPEFNDGSTVFNSDLAAKFGDFIGGFIGSLFSLAGVLLLFETLISQKVAFQKQQFEAKFFDLLNIYRENVSEMVHIPPSSTEPVSGRRVFIEMRKQFGEIYEKVCEIAKVNESDLGPRDKVNISYLILFFGLGDTSTFVLNRYLTNYKNYKTVINEIIYNFSFDQADSCKYDGHQSRLGHYFRHLFQMVQFVEKEKFLSENEKYFFVKTLRAQMSTFELAIFFFNSLSDFGRPWSNGKVHLINKYQFLKNIPFGFTFDIDPKYFYPEVNYEAEELNVIPS